MSIIVTENNSEKLRGLDFRQTDVWTFVLLESLLQLKNFGNFPKIGRVWHNGKEVLSKTSLKWFTVAMPLLG